ncbi:MAG: hypothetical protein V1495_08395 [Pseudomonadota bacterium]
MWSQIVSYVVLFVVEQLKQVPPIPARVLFRWSAFVPDPSPGQVTGTQVSVDVVVAITF